MSVDVKELKEVLKIAKDTKLENLVAEVKLLLEKENY